MQELIYHEAARLFGLHGLRSVTMEDIARSLGVSKKTLYIWFTDKQELISAVYLPFLQSTRQNCLTISAQAPDAIHEAFDCWQEIRLFLLRLQGGLLQDLQKQHPAIYKRYTRFCNLTIPSLFRLNLERGQREGLYRDDWSKQLAIYQAKAAQDLLQMLALREPRRPDWYTDDELVVHYLRGLSTPKGQAAIEECHMQTATAAI